MNGPEVYCTIQAAINASDTLDTIYIAPGLYRESLRINNASSRSLTIIGSGISQTIIDSSSRAFLINEDITIQSLTIEKSGPPRSGMGGGLYIAGNNISVNVTDVVLDSNYGGVGGGIAILSGTVYLDRVAVTNNLADILTSDTNSTQLSSGGGIFVDSGATLIANHSVISGNIADIGVVPNQPNQTDGGFGAGIFNLGSTTLVNTTVSGNTANATGIGGGGLTNGDTTNSAVLNLYNVTIANNDTANKGGGVYNFNGTVNIRNSIIASNTDNGTAPDCGGNNGTEFMSLNYNIIGLSTGCDSVFVAAANDTIQVTPPPLNLLPLPSDSTSFDQIPVFLTLGVDSNSLAIDYVANLNNCVDQNNNSLTTDQRGVTRPFDGNGDNSSVCDAGAVELADDMIVYPAEQVTFEDQGTSKFFVALTKPPAQTVQLDISSQMLTEGSIATSAITFNTNDWNIPKGVQINVQNDGLADGNQTYAINVSGGGFQTKSVTVTNIDTVIPPDLVVAPESINIIEGGPSQALSIRLATPPAAGSMVDIVVGNDLVAGVDQQETISTNNLQFNDSNWSIFQDVTVTAVDDTIVDGSVSYNLVVSVAATSTDSSYIGKTASIPITVDDNDQPSGPAGVMFEGASGLMTTEDGGQVTFTAKLTSAPSADVNINFVSNATDEGMLLSGQTQQQALQLTFTPSNWSNPQPVTVVGIDDIYADGGRIYNIITQIISSDAEYSNINPPDIDITNSDNDNPGIIVNPTTNLQTNESGTSVTFQVQLSTPPVPNTQVVLTADVQAPASGQPLEGVVTLPQNQLIFNSNNYNQPQSVTVSGLDDCWADGDKNYGIVITPNTVSTTSPPYTSDITNLQQTVFVTNVDNDINVSPQIILSKTQLQTSENLTADTFDVCITTQPGAPVTITMTIPADGIGEGVFSGNSTSEEIVFDQGNWSVAHTITVAGLDDTLNDGDQTYQIDIAPAVSADPVYADMVIPSVSVTNSDNDTGGGATPGLIVTKPSLSTSEDGNSDTFSISLASQPSSTVYVLVTIEDQSEGRISGNPTDNQFDKTLIFESSNWNTKQFITIDGIDDLEQDGNVQYTISMSILDSSAPEYMFISAQLQVVNEDNELPAIPALLLSESALITSEDSLADSFSFALASQPSTAVYVMVTVEDQTEGRISGNPTDNQFEKTLTIEPSNWNTQRFITIVGLDDSENDGNVQYLVTLKVLDTSAPEYATLTTQVQVINEDNDFSSPPALLLTKSELRTSEDSLSESFSFALATKPSSAVYVMVTVEDETEGRISGSPTTERFTKTVTIEQGSWDIQQNITIVGLDDSEDDGNVQYLVTLKVLDTSAPEYASLTAQVQVINEDNDVLDPVDSTGGGLVNPALLWMLLCMVLLRFRVKTKHLVTRH